MDSNELRAKVEALRAARKPQEWWKNLTLTDYERGRESAKWDIENDPEGFVICFDFPHLAAVLGAEFSRGYRDYGNAWLIVNQ